MLRDHGLTEQQWRVLRALSEETDIDASKLAEKSFLLAPSLTRILQHLETESLISRERSTNDSRRAVVALTAKGRRLFKKMAPQSEALYSVIEKEFGKEKIEQLYDLLADFYQTLESKDPS